jgi:hypothetical protein
MLCYALNATSGGQVTQRNHIYCDESCHLEHDGQRAMVLGAVWHPSEKTREIATRLRELKQKHDLPPFFELKWSKVSPAREAYYREVLDYFFDDDDLHFRALIVPNKSELRHEAFGQDHDDFYYKMYFDLLKLLLKPTEAYRIFLDIKDTRSAEKERKLHDVLCNNLYDFNRSIVLDLQSVRSHEVEQIQLADLLVGIISRSNRPMTDSKAKQMLVDRMRERSGYDLTRTTLMREEKVNLFRWRARAVQV